MRTEPVAPLAVLHVAKEDTELSGYYIPKVRKLTSVRKAHIKIKDPFFNKEYFDAGHSHDLEPVELPSRPKVLG